MSVVWAFSWVLLGLSGLVPGTLGAALLVAACASVFAFGETLLQPTIPALVNDLAPDHLRGRYNALSSGAFQLAAVIAPPIAGLLIGHALGDVYIGLLVVGCLVCGFIAIAYLEPRLDPRDQRRAPGRDRRRRRDPETCGVTRRLALAAAGSPASGSTTVQHSVAHAALMWCSPTRGRWWSDLHHDWHLRGVNCGEISLPRPWAGRTTTVQHLVAQGTQMRCSPGTGHGKHVTARGPAPRSARRRRAAPTPASSRS